MEGRFSAFATLTCPGREVKALDKTTEKILVIS